jgi:uncharacterized small protein (DUF1192 family)
MEPDEPRAARDDVIIPGEDLSDLGVEQLKTREQTLLSELERTRAMTETKQAGLAAADSLFKT